MNAKSRSFGFTLIELLVVITIIGILVSLGTVSYSTTQKQARDSRRRQDLRAIQNAFEQYYADNSSYYPPAADCNPGTTYLPAGMPKDPRTGADYTRVCTGTPGTAYYVTADIEGTDGNASNASCGSYGTCTTCGFFCVKNLQ